MRAFQKMQNEYLNHKKHDPPNREQRQLLNTLSQKSAANQRLQRYHELKNRRETNGWFQQSEKLFYHQLKEIEKRTQDGENQMNILKKMEEFRCKIWC